MAAVLDLDPDLVAFHARADGDGAALVDGMAGVEQDVHEHLVQFRRPALHQRQLAVVPFQRDLVLQLVPDDVDGGIQAGMQVGGFPAVVAAGVGEVLEVAHDRGDPLDALARLSHQLRQVAGDEVDVVARAHLLDLGQHRLRVRQAQRALVDLDQREQAVQVFLQRAQVGVHVADGVVDLVRDAGRELADGGHLLRLHQLFLRTGQAHQGLPQLRVAALQLLLARMRFADVVEDHQAVSAAGIVVEIGAHLQHQAVVQAQVPVPAAIGARRGDRIRRQQPGKRSQRIVFVVHQRQRGGVRMQGARIATAQQVPVIHQFGQRLEVGEGRDIVRGTGAGGQVRGGSSGHGRIGRRRRGASIRRPRGSGKARCRSLRIGHRAQATASGRGADSVDVCPCAS